VGVSPQTGPDPEAIFEEWKTLVANPGAHQDDLRCQVLAAMLAAQAPDRLNAMVDMLTDPATMPKSKLTILFSLENVLNPELTARLLDLTKAEIDGSVRSGVTMLLARSDDPAVLARLRELQNDEDRRVRLGALNALTFRGDEEARARLREMYFEEDLPAPFKERIALTFGMLPESEDAIVLSDAANLETLGDDTRMAVVGALALLQDESALPALRACAEGNYPEDIKALARDAVAAIESRKQNAVDDAAPGEPLPEGETAPKQMVLQ
jgi:HEAT repeat protein